MEVNNEKAIIIYYLFFISLFVYIYFLCDKKDFNYGKVEKETIKYLEQNEDELTKIAIELYENKTSKKMSYKGISYTSYNYLKDFNYKEKVEYVKFSIDSQGMLGGQYYGLIYIKNINENLIIYDENKETNLGNNVFVRKK